MLLATLLSTPAKAQDDAAKDMCLAAFKQTQSLREEGQHKRAREQALTCSDERCPDVIKTKCKTWQREIDESTPTIVVRVIDETGNDTAEATLSVDGALVKQRLDGLPIALDPGDHVVEVARPGQAPRQQRVLLNVGEKRREVLLSFAPDPAPQPPPTPAPAGTNIHVLTYVGFGLAGAGVIVGAVTGGLSLSKTSDLEAACPSHQQCSDAAQELHDEATLLSHTSTIGFAVAGAGAVLGAIGLFVLSDGIFGGDTALTLSPESVSLRMRF